MSDRYYPLFVRSNPELEEAYDALYEGVPGHLLKSLQLWTRQILPTDTWQASGETGRLLLELELALRIEIAFDEDINEMVQGFMYRLSTDEDLWLHVVDYLVRARPVAGNALKVLLSQGGSAWQVVIRGNRWRLERRVDPTVQAIVDAAVVPEDNASVHLAKAWQLAFGLEANAGSSYQEAVKALEAVYAPIVCPLNSRATLGTVISNIESKPSKYRTRLEGKGEGDEGILAVRSLLAVIWRTEARHTPGEATDRLANSIDEARDAVVAAAALVQLVRQGGFSIR